MNERLQGIRGVGRLLFCASLVLETMYVAGYLIPSIDLVSSLPPEPKSTILGSFLILSCLPAVISGAYSMTIGASLVIHPEKPGEIFRRTPLPGFNRLANYFDRFSL